MEGTAWMTSRDSTGETRPGSATSLWLAETQGQSRLWVRGLDKMEAMWRLWRISACRLRQGSTLTPQTLETYNLSRVAESLKNFVHQHQAIGTTNSLLQSWPLIGLCLWSPSSGWGIIMSLGTGPWKCHPYSCCPLAFTPCAVSRLTPCTSPGRLCCPPCLVWGWWRPGCSSFSVGWKKRLLGPPGVWLFLVKHKNPGPPTCGCIQSLPSSTDES